LHCGYIQGGKIFGVQTYATVEFAYKSTDGKSNGNQKRLGWKWIYKAVSGAALFSRMLSQ